jgi:acyl carrier protein
MNPALDSAVQRIFADIFGVPLESIRPDSSPETIETWDSLQHLNLVLALEQEFQVQFDPEEIETLISPERVSAIVGEKLSVMESK